MKSTQRIKEDDVVTLSETCPYGGRLTLEKFVSMVMVESILHL